MISITPKELEIENDEFDDLCDIYECSNNFEENRSKGDDFER